MPSDVTTPLQVFISYSHRDEAFKDDLVVHLATLKRQGKIWAWQDRDIEAGTEWDASIKQELEAAAIILLLITPHFLASDYCYDSEMQRAIQRHEEGSVRVIPIIVKPCDWAGTPFSKLQFLPRDAKPISIWDDQDEAFLNVVKGIRQTVDSLQLKRHDFSEKASDVFPSNDPDRSQASEQESSKSKSSAQRDRASGSWVNSSPVKIFFVPLIVIGLLGAGSWSMGKLISRINEPDDQNRVSGRYKPLKELLETNEWIKADAETTSLMLEIATDTRPSRPSDQEWLEPDDIKNIPCKDILEISQLWTEATQNHLGFNIQSQIWRDIKKNTDKSHNDLKVRKKFSEKLGWIGGDTLSSLSLDDVHKKIINKPLEEIDEGYLPSTIGIFYRKGIDEKIYIFLGDQNEFNSLSTKLQQCSTTG